MHVKYRLLSFMKYPDYRVGTDGSVWSKRKNKTEWKRLKPLPETTGHLYVSLTNDKRKGSKNFKISRLVLFAFVGEPKPGQEACHYPDRDVSNNSLDNLSWGSKKRNQRHRLKHGTDCRGEKNVHSIFSNTVANKIRKRIQSGEKTVRQLATKYGLHYTTIWNIFKNKTYVE